MKRANSATSDYREVHADIATTGPAGHGPLADTASRSVRAGTGENWRVCEMPRSHPSSPRIDPRSSGEDELESRPLFVEIEAPAPASLIPGTERPGTVQVAAPIDGVAWHRKVFTMTDALKWGSLFALVVQNSALFVITRYTRSEVKGHLYLSSVVVLLIELAKMGVCLLLLLREARWRPCMLLSDLYSHLWEQRSTTLLLAVPATCYAIQNNLIFVALSHLSAAAAQVLYQLKSLSTAFFTVVLLHRSFSPVQWLSFVLLTGGVILVQSQDAKSSSSPTGASPLLGVCAALAAATLSGFAGVFLEKMFTSGSTSLWMRNVQLALFAIPLQAIAVWQMDGRHVEKHGLLQGFHASTWLLVLVQLVGALCTAVVIKFAGNVLKTFATVLALLCTCGWSIVSLRIIYCICATASLSRAPRSPSLARPPSLSRTPRSPSLARLLPSLAPHPLRRTNAIMHTSIPRAVPLHAIRTRTHAARDPHLAALPHPRAVRSPVWRAAPLRLPPDAHVLRRRGPRRHLRLVLRAPRPDCARCDAGGQPPLAGPPGLLLLLAIESTTQGPGGGARTRLLGQQPVVQG